MRIGANRFALLINLLGILLLVGACPIHGSRVIKKYPEDIILSPESIFRFGKEASVKKCRSRLPQIDVLTTIFHRFRNDSDLVKARKRLIIRGEDFSRAFSQIEPLFLSSSENSKEGVFQSQLPPPEIKYKNFKNIILYCRDNRYRISIELNEAYTQELPYTFGAKIRLSKIFEGTLRSNREDTITDIVFDDDESVFFIAPGIAFFIPDVYSRIARITLEAGQIFGSVIGRPKSAPNRCVAVKYNLSTCAKSSIKTEEITPDDFSKKLLSSY